MMMMMMIMATRPGSTSMGRTPTLCRLKEAGTWLFTQFMVRQDLVRAPPSATDKLCCITLASSQ